MQEFFPFSKESRSALETSMPPTKWVRGLFLRG